MKLQSYKNLEVWKKSIALSNLIFDLTNNFPKSQVFTLTSQLQRASISIASNIAEGSGRSSTKDFLRFLDISYGSLCELETQIIISCTQKFITKHDQEKLENLCIDIGKMLNGLKSSLLKKLKQSDH